MSADLYRPRHAAPLGTLRAVRETPSSSDALPERTHRAAIGGVTVALSLLLATSVAAAATGTGARSVRAAHRAGAGSAPAHGPATRPRVVTAKAVAPATGPIVRSKNTAPATKTVIAGLAGNGIPAVALNAYRVAADRMASAQPGCGIDWALLAAIGREESDHGRFGGARLNLDGTSTPPIIGPALNGVGNQYIPAPPNGAALDGDSRYTHALGPMQFIPQTWAGYGVDANGDGRADIFNINDAALGAARYLCANGGDLRTRAGQIRAILAYNHSDQYLAQVLALSLAYRAGTPVEGVPVGTLTGPLPPITATGPYAASPGAPTAAGSSPQTAAPGTAPTRSGGRASRPGSAAGGKRPAPGGSTPSGGSSAPAPTGAGPGSHSGGPSAPPAPSGSPSPGGGGAPLPLPSKLPTKLPLPGPTSSSAPAPKPSPTCVIGVAGTCVVP